MHRLLTLLLCCLAPLALAQTDANPPQIETSKVFGDYEVLYTVFPSTTLLPAIAAEYHIVRAGDQAVVNISVRKKQTASNKQNDSGDVEQPAKITGTYSDLIQSRPLEFREIREQGAIYYLAQLHFSDHETLRFDIKVQPQLPAGESAPVGSPFAVTFTRKFFVEK